MSILIAPAVLVGIALLLGAGLVWARSRLPDGDHALIDAIDALLPQTQCAQCGHPGCRPYAEAVAGGAPLDLCPPGGKETAAALRNLLGEDAGEAAAAPQPSTAGRPTTRNGGESPELVAKVREAECVGCALCIKACPVDAIIGAPGFMHAVLERHCTGCELCLPACPVDCIDLKPAPSPEAPVPPSAARKGRRVTPGRLVGQPMRHLASDLSGRPRTPQAVSKDAPCIGCNRCEEACPEALAPQHLLRLLRAGQSTQAAAADLDKCIECRLCDRACPTEIPLAGIFHGAKGELAKKSAKEASAAAAKARFQARKARLAQQAASADARRAERLVRLLDQPSAPHQSSAYKHGDAPTADGQGV